MRFFDDADGAAWSSQFTAVRVGPMTASSFEEHAINPGAESFNQYPEPWAGKSQRHCDKVAHDGYLIACDEKLTL